jgi:hypothetical protein
MNMRKQFRPQYIIPFVGKRKTGYLGSALLILVLAVITSIAMGCVAPVGWENDKPATIINNDQPPDEYTNEYLTEIDLSWTGISGDVSLSVSRAATINNHLDDLVGVVSGMEDPRAYYTAHFADVSGALGFLLGGTKEGTRLVPPTDIVPYGRFELKEDPVTHLFHNKHYTENDEITPIDITALNDSNDGDLTNNANFTTTTYTRYKDYVDAFRRDKFNRALLVVERYLKQFRPGGTVKAALYTAEFRDLHDGAMAALLSDFGDEADAIAYRDDFDSHQSHPLNPLKALTTENPDFYYEGLGSVWFGSLEGHVTIQDWGN